PDAGARRAEPLAGAERLGLLVERVGLPQNVARLRIERDEAASKRAALVVRIARQRLFSRRDRHVQPFLIQRGRARNPRAGVVVGPAPHPFHLGPLAGSIIGGDEVQRPGAAGACACAAAAESETSRIAKATGRPVPVMPAPRGLWVRSRGYCIGSEKREPTA